MLLNLPIIINYYDLIKKYESGGFYRTETTGVSSGPYLNEWLGFWIVVTPIIILILWRIIKKGIIYRKQIKVNSFIRQFSKNDALWNKKNMKSLAENLFYKVQYAWLNNDFKALSPVLTDKIKLEWQDTWQQMKSYGYIFTVREIDIRSINIIAVEDHFDDNRDKFKVEISGYINRFIKNKPDNSLLVKTQSGYDEFMDIYSFVRLNDKWLLDGIDHSTNIREVLYAKNINHHLLN